MRKAILAVVALFLLACISEILILRQIRVDPIKLGGVLISVSLLLGAFVGLTDSSLVRELRHWATQSIVIAGAMPLALLVPYAVYAAGTSTFSPHALLKLAAYVLAPVALLLPDRMHPAGQAGWRDYAAMLVLAFPVSANWLAGIWTWPFELYFYRPLTAVCVGSYSFMIVRNLNDVGYKLTLRMADWTDGLANFVAFSLLALPLGYALHFIHFRPKAVSLTGFTGQLLGIYLTIAIPEELLFRGILQNFLVRSIRRGPKGLHGLLIASLVFGAAHLHHAPVPNWRYGIMASLAGVFYGNAYRTRHRLSAPALTHALVDTAWHFWF